MKSNYPMGVIVEDFKQRKVDSDSITIKLTVLPVRALREIEIKIPLMRCRCWHRHFAKHRRAGFDYFSKTKNRYYMRNSHGKEEEWFDY